MLPRLMDLILWREKKNRSVFEIDRSDRIRNLRFHCSTSLATMHRYSVECVEQKRYRKSRMIRCFEFNELNRMRDHMDSTLFFIMNFDLMSYVRVGELGGLYVTGSNLESIVKYIMGIDIHDENFDEEKYFYWCSRIFQTFMQDEEYFAWMERKELLNDVEYVNKYGELDPIVKYICDVNNYTQYITLEWSLDTLFDEF